VAGARARRPAARAIRAGRKVACEKSPETVKHSLTLAVKNKSNSTARRAVFVPFLHRGALGVSCDARCSKNRGESMVMPVDWLALGVIIAY
jgi:hypothetical protein